MKKVMYTGDVVSWFHRLERTKFVRLDADKQLSAQKESGFQ